MQEFHISPDWVVRLKAAGLDSLEALLAFQDGKCLSSHKRGATFRTVLPSGEVVFIKRDHFTFKKEIAKDLLRFRRPAQKTIKERRAFEAVRDAGFSAPLVIAWGESRHLGLPDKAAFIMCEIPGVNLDSFVRSASRDEALKAIAAAEQTLRELQQAGFLWPDHKPEHFIIRPDGTVAVIDLERLVVIHKPVPDKLAQVQLRRFRSLLPNIQTP